MRRQEDKTQNNEQSENEIYGDQMGQGDMWAPGKARPNLTYLDDAET